MIAAIDFGASATKAAVQVAGPQSAELVRIDNEPQSPTAVFLTRRRTMIVGRAALSSAGQDPARLFTWIKQQINRPDECDPLYQEVAFGRHEAQPLVRTVGRVLGHALEAIKARGFHPEHVVLTHPVHWHDPERAVLVAAAKSAGLPPISLLAEPVAIAHRYALSPDARLPVAVYDLGASTLDIAVVHRGADGSLRTLYSHGQVFGGDDFDEAVLGLVEAALPVAERPEFQRVRQHERAALTEVAQELKRTLAAKPEAVFGFRDFDNCYIYAEDFEAAIRDSLTPGLDALAHAAEAAGVTNPIATVLLSGGGSLTPLVQARVAETAERIDARYAFVGDDPEADAISGAVARGATLFSPPRRRASLKGRQRFQLSNGPIVRLVEPDTVMLPVSPGVALISGGRRVDYREGKQAHRAAQPRSDVRPVRSRITAVGRDPNGSTIFLGTERGLVESWSDGCVSSRTVGDLATSSDAEAVTAVAGRGEWIAMVSESGRGRIFQGVTPVCGQIVGLPARGIAFTDEGLLLWTADRLALIDPPTAWPLAQLPLPEPEMDVLTGPGGNLLLRHAGQLRCYRVAATGFEERWGGRSADVVAWISLGLGPAVLCYDRRDEVYRVLDAGTGQTVAVYDAQRRSPATEIVAGVHGRSVYVRSGLDVYQLAVEL